MSDEAKRATADMSGIQAIIDVFLDRMIYTQDIQGFKFVSEHISHSSFPDEFCILEFTYTATIFVMCSVCSAIHEISFYIT